MRRRRLGRPLRGLDPARHLDDPALRQRYITAVFDLIAPRYDAFTRWFSFGMDDAWKREVVGLAAAAAEQRGRAVVLDLACGTGDLAFALAAPDRSVVGLDVSREMLGRAAARADAEGAAPPRFAASDMVALPIADASVDVVTIGYGLRNAPRLDAALDEVARVLRPGGHVVTLDFCRPANAIWRRVFLGYLAVAGNLYGWAWHREPAAYGYIPRSIARFVTADQLTAALTGRGFDVYCIGRRLLGGICVHAGRKEGRGASGEGQSRREH
ncbi:MAG: ubiquinone/menaquinone biosynthesis methyltransferase [Gemmatimonadota bacterium]|nr:ubiquinone/menaquinone biosynthesis methyltransferase [Gemmatimonadota bacterium]